METPTSYMLLAILLLTVASAYFSSSETAMMALNRYRKSSTRSTRACPYTGAEKTTSSGCCTCAAPVASS